MATAWPLLKRRLDEVFDAKGDSVGGAVSFQAFGRWCFSPDLYAATVGAASIADFIMVHSVFSFPVLVGYVLARRYRKPYGVWPHGVLAPIQRGISRRKKAVYTSLVARRILDSASVLFFSARGEREEARDLGLRAPSVIIPHGIDVNRFATLPPPGTFRRKYLQGRSDPIVLFLGRLNAKKGLNLLIEAVDRVKREIPAVQLVIAGAADPPAFSVQVRSWLETSGMSRTTVLTGMLDEHDKLAAFADCDVFAMPSVAENFGFSMFEAMACRRAVVCSDTLNYAPEVRNSEAAMVVPRTAEAFSEAIVTLLRNPARRAAMVENGFALASKYSWESCGRLLETAISCVLTDRPFPSALHPA